METNNKPRNSGNLWLAGILIVVGLLLLGRNLHIIDYDVFRILVSWQMLLIVIGFNLFTKKQYTGSILLMATGVYFLLPKIHFFNNLLSVFFWPVVLIIAGVLFIVTRQSHVQIPHHRRDPKTNYHTEDGFIYAENTMGSIRQTIVDDVIKGGFIKSSLGSVVLDLRRTSLPEGVTYIDLDVSLGNAEIHAPSHWKIVSELSPSLGGYSDSRLIAINGVDNDRTLILRGNVVLGSVEIKN
ncbi:cell wall-active antibiotics response protein [Bacteroides sp. OttesenSCG-928-D19]|nr:cell wall-active antibiotics response protein [Bacteroides sp. OttesenSCG-928-N06]MDL2304937.1 cell wall-active antibiotics response protein [Bacteroides sp. OttesenSCG-928-D19]